MSECRKLWTLLDGGIQRIPNLTGPVDNNDVTLQRNRNKTAGRIDGLPSFYERIPNLSPEQSDGITVFRISTMTSLMLHWCRTGSISLQRWWQYPSSESPSFTTIQKNR
ncbi:hypothetical protein ANN_20806 [Periplaneta americana]|uniref:Uncharacterized protein n=1 Tax=Periplaneta americana TaxID=6978 RepID=A0ABQ8SDS9_PERAM|nr:hypothetical protein ANN_20806 [Periplaneta americana]